MSYCLNPQCSTPINESAATICATCQTPLQLKQYKALRLLGQGGFGRTFLAVDVTQALKPRCVIKQLFPQQQDRKSQEKAIALFYKEAHQLKRLESHPQVPDLYDFFEQDGYHYLIQELVDGQNLSQELAQSGAYSENQVWQLLSDVVPVLQFIHKNQVIHRDIKPANIIRRLTDGQLFLVDLGAAKQATGTALALTGTVIGSAEFTAPEQARGKATFASDIYSLGVTCVHLLTNTSPFNLFDGGEGRWVWQDYLSNSVSYDLRRLLDKMIQQPTNHRYQTADQLQQVIRQKMMVTTKPIKPSSAILQGARQPKKQTHNAPLSSNLSKQNVFLEHDKPESVPIPPLAIGSKAALEVQTEFPAQRALNPQLSTLKVPQSAKNPPNILIKLVLVLLALLAMSIGGLHLPYELWSRLFIYTENDEVKQEYTFGHPDFLDAPAGSQALTRYPLKNTPYYWNKVNTWKRKNLREGNLEQGIGETSILKALDNAFDQGKRQQEVDENSEHLALQIAKAINQAQQKYFVKHKSFSVDGASQLIQGYEGFETDGAGTFVNSYFFTTYVPEITNQFGGSTIAVTVAFGIRDKKRDPDTIADGPSYIITIQALKTDRRGEYEFKSTLCDVPLPSMAEIAREERYTELFPYLTDDGDIACPAGSGLTTQTIL